MAACKFTSNQKKFYKALLKTSSVLNESASKDFEFLSLTLNEKYEVLVHFLSLKNSDTIKVFVYTYLYNRGCMAEERRWDEVRQLDYWKNKVIKLLSVKLLKEKKNEKKGKKKEPHPNLKIKKELFEDDVDSIISFSKQKKEELKFVCNYLSNDASLQQFKDIIKATKRRLKHEIEEGSEEGKINEARKELEIYEKIMIARNKRTTEWNKILTNGYGKAMQETHMKQASFEELFICVGFSNLIIRFLDDRDFHNMTGQELPAWRSDFKVFEYIMEDLMIGNQLMISPLNMWEYLQMKKEEESEISYIALVKTCLQHITKVEEIEMKEELKKMNEHRLAIKKTLKEKKEKDKKAKETKNKEKDKQAAETENERKFEMQKKQKEEKRNKVVMQEKKKKAEHSTMIEEYRMSEADDLTMIEEYDLLVMQKTFQESIAAHKIETEKAILNAANYVEMIMRRGNM